jgi:hypothetical protein
MYEESMMDLRRSGSRVCASAVISALYIIAANICMKSGCHAGCPSFSVSYADAFSGKLYYAHMQLRP